MCHWIITLSLWVIFMTLTKVLKNKGTKWAFNKWISETYIDNVIFTKWGIFRHCGTGIINRITNSLRKMTSFCMLYCMITWCFCSLIEFQCMLSEFVHLCSGQRACRRNELYNAARSFSKGNAVNQRLLFALSLCRVSLSVILWFDFDVPICGWWIIVWFADNLWESSAFWWYSMQMGYLDSANHDSVLLNVRLPFLWINSPISSIWRSHFWLVQSVNRKASPWLSPWLDELSLEKLLEDFNLWPYSPEKYNNYLIHFGCSTLRLECNCMAKSVHIMSYPVEIVSGILALHGKW